MARVNYRESSGVGEGAPALGGIRGWVADRPQMPYLVPFFAFLILMAPASFGVWGGVDWKGLWKAWQPVVYGAKSAAAGVLLWYFWNYYTKVRWTHLGLGVVAGLFGTVAWIGIHYACLKTGWWHPYPASELYNPDVELATQWERWAYLCVRVAGPSLVVPVMEELFFRDFLMRALVRGARFEDVAVGTYTPFALWGMAVVFGVNHGAMWPGGLMYGLLMGVLLIRTKSLGSCIVAHGVTNFTLYLYVIYTGDWQFM